jgi:hypothetical protein
MVCYQSSYCFAAEEKEQIINNKYKKQAQGRNTRNSRDQKLGNEFVKRKSKQLPYVSTFTGVGGRW